MNLMSCRAIDIHCSTYATIDPAIVDSTRSAVTFIIIFVRRFFAFVMCRALLICAACVAARKKTLQSTIVCER